MLVFVMVFALTFCGAVTAHPGHGTEYPEEINITTPDPPQNQSTGSVTGSTSGTSSSTSKSSSSSGNKSVKTKTTASKPADNDAGAQPIEEVSNAEEITNASDTNATSSNNSPWNTVAIVGFLVVGLGAIGSFFKGGLFGR